MTLSQSKMVTENFFHIKNISPALMTHLIHVYFAFSDDTALITLIISPKNTAKSGIVVP